MADKRSLSQMQAAIARLDSVTSSQEDDYIPEQDGPFPTESYAAWAETAFPGKYPDYSYNPNRPHGDMCCCPICDDRDGYYEMRK